MKNPQDSHSLSKHGQKKKKLTEFDMLDSSNLSSTFFQIYCRGISSNTRVNAVL